VERTHDFAYARGAVLGDPALGTRGTGGRVHLDASARPAHRASSHARWRDGEAKGARQLDDYAYYTLRLIDSYQPRLIDLARARRDRDARSDRAFWDEANGGFFESPAGDPHIKVRMKDGFDGADIAGNSIAAQNLQMLGVLLGRTDWTEMAGRTFDYYGARLTGQAIAMPQMLAAMECGQADPRHVVIAGDPDAADTKELVSEFNRRFLPHDQVLLADGGAGQKRLATLASFVAPLVRKDGKATAYVCVNYACRLPTSDRTAFAAQLDASEPAPHPATSGRVK
jgi:uncharacterized protein YyaL (SSP411 family)